MPVYLNKDTGLAESVDAPTASHEMPLVSPEGQMGSAPPLEAPDLIKQGYRQPNQQELRGLLREAHFNEPTEQLKTALEGAGSGATFGLSTGAERMAGVSPEDIRSREEANPGLHMLGEATGVIGSSLVGIGEGALLAKTGAKVGSALAEKGVGKVIQAAGRGAIENALFQTGDEVSKFIAQDPTQSTETAIANVGLSAVLGAGVGGTLGGIGSGLGAIADSKAGAFISDFKGQIQKRLNNPEPLQQIQEELGNYYSGIKSMADSVYGPTGLKAQDIAKAVPELNNAMIEQAGSFSNKMQDNIAKMEEKPNLYPERLTSKLRNDLDTFNQSSQQAPDAPKIFDALQNLKQQLQSYSKFDKFVKPVDEAYDFVKASKDLGREAKAALEDSSVWGKAAERQKSINKAFTEFLPNLEDFERRFTSEVADQRVIDPGKLNTYINQLGKPNAELKQSMMGNFIEAAEKYRNVLNKTHENLGLDLPEIPSELLATKATLQEVTPGARAADALIKKGLGEIMGTGIGSAAGALVGHPALGAIIGERALAPGFNRVIPSILNSILSKPSSGSGLRGAVDFGVNIIKGETRLNNVIKGVFGATREVLSEPSTKDLVKLQERLQKVADNKDDMMHVGQHMAHYMPDHATNLALSAARSVQYLNSLKPDTMAKAVLDNPPVLSKTQEANYNNALKIAQQPLSLMPMIKEGTITLQDIKHLQQMYPALYKRMNEKLINGLIEAKNKQEPVPYKTRLGISMFVGQPLDSSMRNANMSANQATFAPAQAQQEAKNGMMKSSAKPMKSPALANLPDQSREAYRATRHQ